MSRPVGSNIRPGSAVFSWNAVSTTRVPLLVTGAAELDELAELPDAAELAGAEPPLAAAEDGAEELELELLGVLVLLQAATVTTKDAASAPAVHLRTRI
jgi:hypothetical protein